MINDARCREIAKMIQEAREKKAYWHDMEIQLKKVLIECCNEKIWESDHYTFQPRMRKGALQYKNIPELKGVDLDKYRLPTETRWYFRVKKHEV